MSNDELKIDDVEPEIVQSAPKRRGRGVDLSSLDPEALRQHKAAINMKAKAVQKKKQQAEGFVYNSKDEPTKSAAKELIEGRGVKAPHVVDTVYRLLLRAAEDHGIPANRFLFANGLQAALRSRDKRAAQPADLIAAENVPGELLTRAELFALYDASMSQEMSMTSPQEMTFEEFLEVRLRCKSDTYYLGKHIFENDFSTCHVTWRDFFPKWDPTTLPANYTQKQAIDWLGKQSEIKDFLLMASRRAFKSSFARLWLLTAITTLPDMRILIVSETRPLSKDNIEAVRGYFETTPGFETRFQKLFPEFQIPVGDGSVMSLEVPMRRLKLPQSIESSSMDSTVAGRRADIILFDDPISEVSCTNEEQIKKSVNKRDLLVKLKERGGYVISLGTPYAAKDLYYEMIERSKKNNDETFAYRVDPAFVVKPAARGKLVAALLPTLEEHEIESFLFPEGLPWKELRVDMRNNPGFFLSQNLCIFPPAEDDSFRCQFDAEELRARTRMPSFFPPSVGVQVAMSLDRAFSVSRYADYSCLVVGKVQPVQGQTALVVSDMKMDRWRESDLVKQVVDMIEKHQPTLFVAEQDRGWETLAQAIKEQCHRKGLVAPFFRWKVVQPTDRAKAKRVKTLELPLSDGRLWFHMSTWTEAALLQLEKFDGVTKSNSSRKDDFPDALSLLYQEVGPKYAEELKPEDEAEKRRMEEEEDMRMRKQASYNAMFGPRYTPPTPSIAPAPEPSNKPADPRLRLFGNKGPWRL
jgi:Terminase RNaseH-like domain